MIYLAIHEKPDIHLDILRAFFHSDQAHEWLEDTYPFLHWLSEENFYVVDGTNPLELEQEERWYVLARDLEDNANRS